MTVPHRFCTSVFLACLSVATLRASAGAAPTRSASGTLGIAVGSDRVYVAEFDRDRIQAFTLEGEPIAEWGATGARPGEFRGPAGVALGPSGTVYVTDLYNHRVQAFTRDGFPLASWSCGEGSAPCGIAVSAQGRVYVTDIEGSRVASWSEHGVPLAGWGRQGSGPGDLAEPWGIAIDARGDVIVADHGNHRVQRFSADGTFLAAWGERGSAEGRLLGPTGVAVGRDGSIAVADLVGGRVQRFGRDGAPIDLWHRPDIAGVQIDAAAIGPGGDLYLAGAAHPGFERVPAPATQAPRVLPAALELTTTSPARGAAAALLLGVPAPGFLRAEIFGLDGRRVWSAPRLHVEPGERRIVWGARGDDGRAAPPGVYFVRVQFDDGGRRVTHSGRIVVLP